MSEKSTDQKGQGNPNDQNTAKGQQKQGNYGQTPNPSMKEDRNENQNLQPQGDEKASLTGGTTNQQNTGNAGTNTGTQGKNETATNTQRQTKSTDNLKDEEGEEINEYDDLEHPHKVDMPTASNESPSPIEDDEELEDDEADTITNDDKETIY